jgi:hypothetical protein
MPYQLPPPGLPPPLAKQPTSKKFLFLYLLFGGIGVMLGCATVAAGFGARDEYLITRGAAGTAGTVTITHEVDGARGSETCYGSFRPDTGGRRPTDVKVMSDGACKPGKTARAYMKDETAYVAGERQNDWMTIFMLGPFLGACTLLFCGLAVFGLRHERKLRNKARSVVPPGHPEDQPRPAAWPQHP